MRSRAFFSMLLFSAVMLSAGCNVNQDFVNAMAASHNGLLPVMKAYNETDKQTYIDTYNSEAGAINAAKPNVTATTMPSS